MDKKYYIVEFEDGIQIIPENWFTCDKKSAVYWPNLKTQKEYDKAVEKMKDLKNDSITVDIKKIFGSTDNFANAKKKLKLAEKLSDLNSDEDVEVNKKRRRLNAAKNFSSSSEEEIDKSKASAHHLAYVTFVQSRLRTEHFGRLKYGCRVL